MRRRASTWSAARRLQNEFLRIGDMICTLTSATLLTSSFSRRYKCRLPLLIALRFSLSSEILAFRRQHRPNAEQLNCWVCVELCRVDRVSSLLLCRVDLCRVDCNPLSQHGKSLKDECDFTIFAGNVADSTAKDLKEVVRLRVYYYYYYYWQLTYVG